MNVVFIIPTGIGASIGGHAGDATPVAKLIAACCDNLILHPNVVNASAINEMSDNALYVEGSMLDSFLAGHIGLNRSRGNRVLVAVNYPLTIDTINAVNAARATIGMDAEIMCLDTPLEMEGIIENDGTAGGKMSGHQELCKQVKNYYHSDNFGALAIVTKIKVSMEDGKRYFMHGGVNPWGGIEAMLSKFIATTFDSEYQSPLPVAHAPEDDGLFDALRGIVRPAMAAEWSSMCYLHCVLKGLYRAPRLMRLDNTNEHLADLTNRDIDFLVSPDCWGPPHQYATVYDIKQIVVTDNRTMLPDEKNRIQTPSQIIVDNYLEAAGVIMAARAGVSLDSVMGKLVPAKINGKHMNYEEMNEFTSLTGKELKQ